MRKLKIHANKSLINKGIQTKDIFEILKFPRSTQTEFEEQKTSLVNSTKVSTQTDIEPDDTQIHVEKYTISTQTEVLANNVQKKKDECLQTEYCNDFRELHDESTQTLKNMELEYKPPKKEKDLVNMPEFFLCCNKSENSPFAAILPSVTRRSFSSSVSFPSFISHALKSGAGAGTNL